MLAHNPHICMKLFFNWQAKLFIYKKGAIAPHPFQRAWKETEQNAPSIDYCYYIEVQVVCATETYQ